jgi:uncharacterized membrane protein YhaH (DUF805 family)
LWGCITRENIDDVGFELKSLFPGQNELLFLLLGLPILKSKPINQKTMFQHPFSFEGRIRRMEYGLSILIIMVSYFIMFGLAAAIGNRAVAAIAFLMYIPIVWFAWAQAAKRCHDLGRSGWWQLIPFYGLFLLFAAGDPGRNEYGQNPKEDPDGQQFSELNTETLDGHLKDTTNN